MIPRISRSPGRLVRAGLVCCAATCAAPPGNADPNYVLRASQVLATPGATVTIAVTFSNTGFSNVAGWSYGLSIPAPLTFSNWRNGSTTVLLAPAFAALNSYPGTGVTAGVVIDFFGVQSLPPGSNYELQLVDVTVPLGAAPGTVFTLAFADSIGSPPVSNTIVLTGGTSVVPDIVSGTITVVSFARYCFGDGSGTACPCGNHSAPILMVGCRHSFGQGGGLSASGSASIANDTIVLEGYSMTESSALFYQGTSPAAGGLGTTFGDGLRCVTGTVIRLGTKTNVSGISRYPEAGDAPIHVRGQITLPGTRYYQVWYRNAAAFCTSSAFNLTSGMVIAWGA